MDKEILAGAVLLTPEQQTASAKIPHSVLLLKELKLCYLCCKRGFHIGRLLLKMSLGSEKAEDHCSRILMLFIFFG